MYASKEWVKNILNKCFKITIKNQLDNEYRDEKFRYAVNDNGEPGCLIKKDGADTFVPFKKSGGGESEMTKYVIDTTDTTYFGKEIIATHLETSTIKKSSFDNNGHCDLFLNIAGKWSITCEDNSIEIVVPQLIYPTNFRTLSDYQSLIQTLRGYSAAKNDNYPGITVSSKTVFNGSYVVWQAFDGNASTHYISTANETSNGWVLMQFTNPCIVKKIYLADSFGAGWYIIDFRLQGSNDNANWDTLLTIKGRGQGRGTEYDVDNVNEYLYYRIYIDKTPGGSSISEAKLYGYWVK